MSIQQIERKWEILEEERRRIERLQDNVLNTDNLLRELDYSQEKLKLEYFPKLTAWDKVYLSRHAKRPKARDFINYLIDDMVYLHGDRLYGEDGTIIGGIGRFEDMPVTVIGTNKGKNTKENITANFGMANPEGYRKSLRLMKQAEKFGRPVITIIDTPGAYPGIGAEERGQGEAIARNLFFMSDLKVPIIAIITGEGGSGGALALAVSDKIFMLENATFSILSPEGFASILWKNASLCELAAEKMKLTANDLKELELIDGVIREGIAFSEREFEAVIDETRNTIRDALCELCKMDKEILVAKRYDKYRKIGRLVE